MYERVSTILMNFHYFQVFQPLSDVHFNIILSILCVLQNLQVTLNDVKSRNSESIVIFLTIITQNDKLKSM